MERSNTLKATKSETNSTTNRGHEAVGPEEPVRTCVKFSALYLLRMVRLVRRETAGEEEMGERGGVGMPSSDWTPGPARGAL